MYHIDLVDEDGNPVADEVTGEVIMGGLVQDDNDANSGIPAENAMKYYIPKCSEKDAAANTISSWKTAGLSQNSISWKLTLNDLKTEYTDKPDYAEYETSLGSGLYQLPVWFRVIDNVGNVGYIKENSIKYNPDAIIVIKSTIPVGYTDNIRNKFHCDNILFSPEFLFLFLI